MVVRSHTRSITSIRLLCETAQSFGVDPAFCLENTGVDLGDLTAPTTQISTEQEILAIENFVRRAPNQVGLGIALGQRMHVNAFGIWGFAILTSPTLRSAIQTSMEFVKLSFVIADLALRESGERARLEFDMTGLPPAIRHFVLERHSVVTMNFIEQLIPEPGFQDFQIETAAEDPAYAQALFELTRIRAASAMPSYALSFPAHLLDQPLQRSDPVSLKYCLDQCKALVEESEGALPPWSQKVRDAIIDDIGSEQRIEDIADKLTMTERTLRRRLTEEGTNFRGLYTDARMAIAYELLEAAGLNVETVAWRVGYSEPASFVRAFSKKFGRTPGDVRKHKALAQTA